jgi:ribokinase
MKAKFPRPAPVLVVGSSNTDLVLSCTRLPRPGETLLGGEFQSFRGGKGANQAVAAARAGGAVTFIGARGDDDFGAAAEAALRAEGIDTGAFLRKKGLSSGVALILVGGKSRENMIGVARSANDALTPADLRKAAKRFRQAAVVVCQLETPLPTVQEAARLARAGGIPFLLNPAPARPLPAALLRQVHTLIPNEHEAALLAGKDDPRQAGEALLKKGCAQVVVTLGARGALLVRPGECRRFPAPRVKPVDTVGAGDCFTGWLAAGLAENLPVEQAIERAIAAAAYSVTRPGAQSAMPRLRDLRRTR